MCMTCAHVFTFYVRVLGSMFIFQVERVDDFVVNKNFKSLLVIYSEYILGRQEILNNAALCVHQFCT